MHAPLCGKFISHMGVYIILRIKNKDGGSKMEEIMNSFGVKLRMARETLGITQSGLGKLLHVERNTVSSWECGRTIPDLRTAKMISLVLGVSLDELTD